MFARNFLNSFVRNNSLMITRSQLKNQIPSRLLSSSDLKVVHCTRLKLFAINIDDSTAYVKYRKSGNVMRLLTTQVPSELGGKGVGKILAKATFEFVRDNDLKMVIFCSFLQNYLDKYGQEFQKYVVD